MPLLPPLLVLLYPLLRVLCLQPFFSLRLFIFALSVPCFGCSASHCQILWVVYFQTSPISQRRSLNNLAKQGFNSCHHISHLFTPELFSQSKLLCNLLFSLIHCLCPSQEWKLSEADLYLLLIIVFPNLHQCFTHD